MWSGRVRADVAVASSGEAGEVEVTRSGGTQEGQSDSGFSLTRINTWQCHPRQGAWRKEVEGVQRVWTG